MNRPLETLQTDILAQIVTDLLSPKSEDNREGCQQIDELTGTTISSSIFEAVSLTVKTLKILQGISLSTREMDTLPFRIAAQYERLCRSP